MVGQMVLSRAEAKKVTRFALVQQLRRKHELPRDEFVRRRRELLQKEGLSEDQQTFVSGHQPSAFLIKRALVLRQNNLDDDYISRMIDHFTHAIDDMFLEAYQSDDPIKDLFVFKDSLKPPE